LKAECLEVLITEKFLKNELDKRCLDPSLSFFLGKIEEKFLHSCKNCMVRFGIKMLLNDLHLN
jgi:hypothetical protein